MAGSPATAWWTGQAEGDLRLLAMGTRAPAPVPATRLLRRLHQVHGATVVTVGSSDPVWADPPEGDALVAQGAGQVLAVLTADCAAVALGSAEGVYGAVHAGWRGLLAGVVEEALSAVDGLGGTEVVAGLGPCIGPCCYEFADDALDELSARYGAGVRSRTKTGAPALDLPFAVRRALEMGGARLVVDDARCTGCDGDLFSHRRRADRARQALFVWNR